MLPARSRRYAGVDGEIPRLVLASNWQLGLIALLVLALLFLIFPRKALVEQLYQQNSLDELTLSYIQNLYRADPSNVDVGLLLAKSQQERMSLAELEALLVPLVQAGDERQRTGALTMLLNRYQKVLASPLQASERAVVVRQLGLVLEWAALQKVAPHLAQQLAALAFEVNLPRLGLLFFDQVEPGQSLKTLERYARQALGNGSYALAARYFLMARDGVVNTDDARRLFMAGIDTLMAASQFEQAMQLAEQHLGGLDQDAPTLRYLARTALAAGQTARAAYYARALVFEAVEVPGTP